MKAIFFTHNLYWCTRTPKGWTYVLVHPNGLVKFGKTISTIDIRISQLVGYEGFRFSFAFADAELEPILNEHFENNRCCYIQKGEYFINEYENYRTFNEIENSRAKYIKTRKELFRLDYQGGLFSYLEQELEALGFKLVEMTSADDVMPFTCKEAIETLGRLVDERALKLAKNK